MPCTNHRAESVAQRLHHRARRRSAGAGERGRPGDRCRSLSRPAPWRPDFAQGHHRSSRRADDRGIARARRPHRHGATQPSSVGCGEAGAIFIGKTNLHEFALGTTNEDSALRSGRCIRSTELARRAARPADRPRRVLAGMALRLDRHRHRRVDSHSVGCLRPGRPEADARRDPDRRHRPAERDNGPRGTAVPVGRGRSASLWGAARRSESRTRRRRATSRTAFRRARAATSSICSTRRSRPHSTSLRTRSKAAGAMLDEVEIPHAKEIAADLPAHRPGRGGGLSRRRRSKADADDYTPERAPAARDGALHPRGGLRARAARTPGADAEKSSGAARPRCAVAAVAASAGDQARRGDGDGRRRSKNPSATSRCG